MAQVKYNLKHFPLKQLCYRDFPLLLFETKPGPPDVKSGIHPGLVTVTVKDVLSKSPNLMVDVKRPILISLSEEKLCQLKMIKEEMEVFQSRNDNILESPGNSERRLPFTSVDVTTSQIMCKYDFKNNNFAYSLKCGLGQSCLKLNFNNSGDFFAASTDSSLERAFVVLMLNAIPHSLVDPCNIEIVATKQFRDTIMFRNINLKLKLSHCIIHFGPNHVHIIDTLKKNLETIADQFETKATQTYEDENVTADESPVLTDTGDAEAVEELHFQDDLRAGAFQFVEAAAGGEEPAPYQAVFGRNTLTWRYPQRRTLTRAVIFPLPFMEASDLSFDMEDGVDCELLYWAETLQHYTVYQTFQLSESRVLHLDLPLVRDRKLCASSHSWQVSFFSLHAVDCYQTFSR